MAERPTRPTRRGRGVRRRLATCCSAALLSMGSVSISLSVVRGDDGAALLPGTVIAARDSPARAFLTSSCATRCAGVPKAAACLSVDVNRTTCEATRQMSGVTCQDGAPRETTSELCLTPDATRWRILLTSDPELLALGRRGVVPGDDTEGGAAAPALVLNAGDVDAIQNLVLPATATQLVLRAADASERLATQLAPDALAKWTALELLSIRNFDLSALDAAALPPFPKLGSIDLSSTKLKQWAKLSAPALSVVDLSSNELTSLPSGSLSVNLNVLNVSGNRLIDLPADVSAMETLYKLSVSHNNLSQLKEFPKLPALKELYLSSSSLSVAPPGLANLPLLQTLDLSNNQMGEMPGISFPASLISLNLRNCSLANLPGDFGIEKTWDLIDLSDNPFVENSFNGVMFRANNLVLEKIQLTGIPANVKTWAIGNSLSLSSNPLGSVNSSDLPASIAELRLSECFLKEVPPNLSMLKRLTTLDLSKSLISPVIRGSLPPQLTQLILSSCMLPSVPDDVQAMSSTLQKLDLSFNNISSINLKNFSALTRLNLQNNTFTTIPADVFALGNLTNLDLSGNPITDLVLNSAQIDFLSTKLRTFAIDASAFATKAECAESKLLRGKYTVCTRLRTSADPVIAPSDTPATSTPATTAKVESEEKSTSTIINVLVGCAIAIVFTISLIVARRPWRKRDRDGPSIYDSMTSTRRYAPIDMWEDRELLRWRVDVLDIELVMQIDSGANSLIWLARYMNDTVVAKQLHHSRNDPRAFERFIEEIKFLGRLEHPKIVQFIGVSWTCESDLQMLLEFMANGDLQKYLATTKSDESARRWCVRKLAIAMDIAEALVFLHSHDPALLHRDLKSRHVLLDENYTAKVSDFGMCKQRVSEIDLTGSNRSIAPEVLCGRGSNDRAVDMYAFGVILAELDTHELPFSDIMLSNGEPLSEMAMLELLSAGALQPTISPGCPDEIAHLIMECLSYDPTQRPRATEAKQRLEAVVGEFLGISEDTDAGGKRRRYTASFLEEKREDDELAPGYHSSLDDDDDDDIHDGFGPKSSGIIEDEDFAHSYGI